MKKRKAPPKRELARGAVTLPMDVQHVIADLWTNQVGLVQHASSDAERELAAHRENVARAAFFLLREFSDRPGETEEAQRHRFAKASQAATAARRALGDAGGFVSPDRRGNAAAKRLLLDVAEQALALYLPHRTKVKRRLDAYVADDGALRGGLVPTDAAERIAVIINWFGLNDPACVGMFGLPSGDALGAMTKGIKRFIDRTSGMVTLDAAELCGHALVAGGLVTPKERSDFFAVEPLRRPRGVPK